MPNATCKACGLRFTYEGGRGRPRIYCDEHRRIDPRRRAEPRERSGECIVCGSPFEGIASKRYCSNSCKWRGRDWLRAKCSKCGGLTGQTVWAAPDNPTCRPCTRGPNYRESRNKRADGYVERWTCAECGVDCERPATKGQRPKYCDTCRRVRRNPLISLRHSERLALYARDGWTCWLCGDGVDRTLIGTYSEWRPSLDHVIPRSRGGSDAPENLHLAHWWCNIVRCDERAYTLEDFRAST